MYLLCKHCYLQRRILIQSIMMNDCGHLVMTEISLIEFFDFFFNRVCIEKNYTRVMSLHRGPENFKKSKQKTHEIK